MASESDTITVDGVDYVRAYHVADGKCVACGCGPRQWTPGQVLDAIRAHAGHTGRAPSRHEWRVSTPEHPEFQVAVRMFGNWNSAIRAAGLKPQEGGGVLYWTPERIISAMVAWGATHGKAPTVRLWAKASPAHPAARTVMTRFGTWNAALDAAGFYPRGSYGVRLRADVPAERIGKVDAAPVADVIRREHNDRTFANIAHDCDVDVSYLEKIVRGNMRTIRADFADRILVALDRPHVFAEAAA